MSLYAWLTVAVLSGASVVGLVVFLVQYRSRRAVAMLALVAAMAATLALCAFTFLAGPFRVNPLGPQRLAMGQLFEPSAQTAGLQDSESENTNLSPEAYRYLGQALDLMAKHSINRDQVDWDAVRKMAYSQARGAQTTSDTYAAIRSALTQLGDHHSRFSTPEQARALKQSGVEDNPTPEVRLLSNRFGYLLLPGYSGIGVAQGNAYATELQQKIRTVADQDPCGWIVDLRQDTGGNMWPMLAGIGPVLGEGRVGAFMDPGGQATYWSYLNGEARLNDAVASQVNGEALQLAKSAPPVAVLTSPSTASSGEAIVVAFRERADTRSFGQETAGRSTANSGFALRDGAMIFLTVSTFADRTGRLYGGPIAPDEITEPLGAASDPVLQGAIQWLSEQCR